MDETAISPDLATQPISYVTILVVELREAGKTFNPTDAAIARQPLAESKDRDHRHPKRLAA
jgi:hypothetical protein